MSAEPFPYIRSAEATSRRNSRLLLIDMQEKLVHLIHEHQRVTKKCRMLLDGAAIFGVPITVTEQYPQGLGPTVAELRTVEPLPGKRRFSAAEALNWGEVPNQPDQREQVIVCGIEAHVCVMQTVLDLLAMGYRVYVAADAVSSRNARDYEIALQRMTACGAILTTAESVLFEWCEVAEGAEFKQLSQLIKANA